uniref:DNA-directed RNA polymerase n=1 Tax=viral metagenome TaxID=1070528 RepID=A0A6C0BDG7_9ZZZZ
MSSLNKETKTMNNLQDNIMNLVSYGNNNDVNIKDCKKIADLYFNKEFYRFRHLHHSFDNMVSYSIPKFFLESKHVFSQTITDELDIKHKLIFKNIRVEPPKMSNGIDPLFPSDARHLLTSYNVTIYADVTQIREVTEINNTSSDNTVITESGHTEMNKPIMILPVMVKSKYCNLNIHREETKDECVKDPGGYFIVNGSEKILIPQDSMIKNYPLVFQKKNSNITYNVVQVNSKSSDIGGITQTLSIKIKKDNVMIIRIPFLQEVNIITIFRALGLNNDKEIIECCVYDKSDTLMIEMLRTSFDKCIDDRDNITHQYTKIQTFDNAIDYLINKLKIKKHIESSQKTKNELKKMHLLELLNASLLPHIKTLKHKAYYIGYMVNKLLQVQMGKPLDNRDSYCKKRVDNVKELLEEIMVQQYKNIMGECNKQFINKMENDTNLAIEPYNILHYFKASIFDQGFRAALSLGNWPRKSGVAQMIQRISYLQLLTLLSRIDSQSGTKASSKLTKPRQIDPSSVPFLCPVSTPEHAKIGLIKHLTLISSITISDADNTMLVREFINQNITKLSDMKTISLENNYKVFLNGEWLGIIENRYRIGDNYTDNPLLKFYSLARTKKISGYFDPQMTSIALDYKEKEIRFCTDAGRLYRPVIRVNGDNEMVITKDILDMISLDVLEKGKISDWDEFYRLEPYPIEFIDTEEQPYMMIAHKIENLNFERYKIQKSLKYRFTSNEHHVIDNYDDKTFVRYNYVEIHPVLLLGEMTANLPFCDKNQSPRNIFSYAQGKQGMSIFNTVYRSRTDISYVLYHPETPVVDTIAAKYTNIDYLPRGSNAVVAVACFSGYNQEDSLIISETAVERGLFMSMNLTKIVSSITKNHETSGDDKFMKPPPDKTIYIKNGKYDKMNDMGYIPEETPITYGDVILGKVTPINDTTNSDKIYKDSSSQYKSYVDGVIDRVHIGIKNQDGHETRKVLVRSERTPQIGDKMCCYTPDHEVLTTDGWIPFDKLTMEHSVACLMFGNTLVYSKPKALQKYEHDGEMYEINSNQVQLCVTLNHRMWTKKIGAKNYGIEYAGNIVGKRRFYQKNVDRYHTLNEHPMLKYEGFIVLDGTDTLPRILVPLKPFLMFMGIWYAEGFVNQSTCWGVTFAAHKQRVKEALTKCCEEMKLKLYKHKTKDNETNSWNISDKRFVKFFKPLSVGAVNKSLPDFVWELDMVDAKELIKGMVLGDGHTMNNGTQRYDTSSIKLANDFQRLCLHAGYSTNIAIKYEAGQVAICKAKGREGEVFKSTTDAYRMTIITTQNNPKVNKNKNSDRIISYKGNVYCCSVPFPEGVIYVRRKGYPVWCGQSLHGQKGTIGIKMANIDLPFTKHGLRPDIIMNTHAVPSRMTLGQMWESIFGKTGSLQNRNVDGTPFENHDLEPVQKELVLMGYKKDGTEVMYNGMTGLKLKYDIYIGPTFYQRLRHMTQDKIHCLTPDHVVLTSVGWKSIEQVLKTDMIAISKNTYVYPESVLMWSKEERTIVDIMYNDKSIMQRVTEEHKIYLSRVSDMDTNKYNDFELIEISKLINGSNGMINGRMMSGSNDIINGPFYYYVSTISTPVYCLTVPEHKFIVKHISNIKTENLIDTDKQCYKNYGIITGNSRARGPLTILTHQAPEGRSRDGGLRLGEMERDALIAHGISRFVKERLMDCSDPHKTFVCGKCGMFAIREESRKNEPSPLPTDTHYCPMCNNYTDIQCVVIPYAFKLLIQEVMAFDTVMRLIPEKEIECYDN